MIESQSPFPMDKLAQILSRDMHDKTGFYLNTQVFPECVGTFAHLDEAQRLNVAEVMLYYGLVLGSMEFKLFHPALRDALKQLTLYYERQNRITKPALYYAMKEADKWNGSIPAAQHVRNLITIDTNNYPFKRESFDLGTENTGYRLYWIKAAQEGVLVLTNMYERSRYQFPLILRSNN